MKMEYVKCDRCRETLGECRCPERDSDQIQNVKDWVNLRRRQREAKQSAADQEYANLIAKDMLADMKGGNNPWGEDTVLRRGSTPRASSAVAAEQALNRLGFTTRVDCPGSNCGFYIIWVYRPKED